MKSGVAKANSAENAKFKPAYKIINYILKKKKFIDQPWQLDIKTSFQMDRVCPFFFIKTNFIK